MILDRNNIQKVRREMASIKNVPTIPFYIKEDILSSKP